MKPEFSWTDVLTKILTIFLKEMVNNLTIFVGIFGKSHYVIWKKCGKEWLSYQLMHVNLSWIMNIDNYLLSAFSSMQKSRGYIGSPCLAPIMQEKNHATFPFSMIDSLTECKIISIQSQNFWSKSNRTRTLIIYTKF